jgi:hypothetical protein
MSILPRVCRTVRTFSADYTRAILQMASTVRLVTMIIAGSFGRSSPRMFAGDQALVRWLTEQAASDLSCTAIDLDRTRNARSFAAQELSQPQPAGRAGTDPGSAIPGRGLPAAPGGGAAEPPHGPGASGRVFIVHGRDGVLAARFRDLLRAVGLEPLEWEPLVRATRKTAPFLGDVVAAAPGLAQATLVLLSPDDIVELHPELVLGNDRPAERARSMQARPNVYYELGLAMMACPERTVVVEVGDMRPAGDLAGLNVVRFTGSLPAVNKVLERLDQAGCPVDRSGTDWMDPGRFAGLAAYQRGPDSP